jgi:predicted lipid-binding transport protein (Tim44 family)
MASGPSLRDALPGGRPAAGGFAGFGGGSAPADQPIEVSPADFDAFEKLLGEIQTAYGREDLNTLRAHLTPEMLSYFADELAQNASRGVVNQVSDVKLLQGDLSEAWREVNDDYATVAMRYSLNDKIVDRATGRVVEEEPSEATELWTFRRARGGDWLLSAIQQT